MKQTAHHSVRDPWLPQGRPREAAAIRLFCFHHAGGSAAVFREWQRLLPPQLDVCPVELPGHGTRMHERPLWRMTEIIDDLERGLAPWLRLPFAFFGHSMGAAIAFELTHRLRSGSGIEPRCLFVAGRRAPGRPVPAAIHHLPQPLFIDEIRRLNGTPEELLSNAEMLEIVLPMLRADFAVIETCTAVERTPLHCPVLAFGGHEDEKVSHDDVLAWRRVTAGEFSMHMLNGDHFFLNGSRSRLLQILTNRLLASAAEQPDTQRELAARGDQHGLRVSQ